MDRSIVTKFGVCLETKPRYILYRSWVGYADVPPFSHLGNGWTDCTEIWLVVRDPLAWRFTKVNAGYRCTCAPLFRIPGTAGRITLKLGVWLEDH